MALQMIWQAEVADFDAWYKAFKADWEARDRAGLSTLQVWHDADDTGTAWVLLRVNDRKKAETFVGSDHLGIHKEQGGIRRLTTHLLETV